MKIRTVNKINSVGLVWTFSVMLLFGILFSAVAFLGVRQEIPEDYIETEAKIIRIEEELSPNFVSNGKAPEPGDYDHYVFVEYSYGGRTYSDLELGRYSSSMKEGDTVLLYVDPADPMTFMGDPADNITFLIVGIIVVLIGAGGIGYCIYKKKRRIT